MIRFVVAFCAAVAGGAVVIADYIFNSHFIAPLVGAAQQNREREAFEACITFYGIAYATGRTVYTLLGADAETAELKKWSSLHLIVLNVVGGSWLLVSGWQALQIAMIPRPSMAVGAVLFGLAAYDSLRRPQGDFFTDFRA